MSKCTSAVDVAALTAPTQTVIDLDWLANALSLPRPAIASASMKPFESGGSPIRKAKLTVTYANGNEAKLPRSFFVKLLDDNTSTSTTGAQIHGASLFSFARREQKAEAAFYAFA